MTVFEDREVEFVLGEGEESGIIDGLDVAIKKMKNKEKCRLEIQPSMAYGEQGNTDFDIPPNSVLQYDVEMLKFEKVCRHWWTILWYTLGNFCHILTFATFALELEGDFKKVTKSWRQ